MEDWLFATDVALVEGEPVGGRVEVKVGKRGGMERMPEGLLGVLDRPVESAVEFKRFPIRLVNQLGSWGTRSGLGGIILGCEPVSVLTSGLIVPVELLGDSVLLKVLD